MSRLINMVKDRNEKTLLNTCSIIPNCPTHIDENQESWCLGDFNQESISLHKFELDQFQNLDKLASFSFNEIELKCECDPASQPCDSVSIIESMLTLVSLPSLDQFFEPIFIPVPIYLGRESPILDSTFH